MSELAPIAGTNRKVKIGGKEYIVSSLTIDDLAEFEEVVKRERNEILFKSIKDIKNSGLSSEDMLSTVIAQASKPISIDDVQAAMNSMVGVRFLLWCALRKNQPELKLEEMGELITLDNFEDASKVVSELGGKAVKETKKNIKGGLKK